MVRAHLKGVHVVRKRLAGGMIRTYHYAWRGGPRLTGQPGSPEYVAGYAAAHAERRRPPDGVMQALISEYRATPEFLSLRPTTRSSYARHIATIEAEFGDLPIAALSDPAVRGEFKRFRDTFQSTPRKADLIWTVLARILSVAKDRGRIQTNPCERGGRLAKADRRDRVWSDVQINQVLAGAPRPIADALMLAIWTGQRQGDLLALAWSAYDGTAIRIRQGKTGARVLIPVAEPLRMMLESRQLQPADPSRTILRTSRDTPWTADGFKSSWGKAIRALGIDGLTFHDLRGSAVTRLALAGCAVPEIAAITGHSLKDAATILDAHYLGRDPRLAEAAIARLEARYGLQSTDK